MPDVPLCCFLFYHQGFFCRDIAQHMISKHPVRGKKLIVQPGLDFLEGAALSRGGKGFICMTSTYRDRTGTMHSRIKPSLQGDIATAPRTQAYFMVTEFGCVNLVGRSTWERAEMLISIAHPDFRDGLIRAADYQKIWRRSNKR